MDGRTAIAGHSPHRNFDAPARLSEILTGRILPLVSRPARYIGGELGADPQEWQPGLAKILLAFPDTYEIGMSHTGLRILWSQLKRHEHALVDLAFTPWPDMEEQMRETGLPLFGLHSRRSARQFDVIGFSLCYELTYTNLLTMIDLAGVSLLADERKDGDPVIIAGGACALNPRVMEAFVDVFLMGDGEKTVCEVADTVKNWRESGADRVALCDALARLPGAWRAGAGDATSRVEPDLNRHAPPAHLVPIIEPVHDRLSLEIMRGCSRGCRFCQAGMINRPVRERDVNSLVAAAEEGIAQSGWDEISLLSLSTSDYSGLADTVAGIQDRLAGSRTNLVVPSLRMDSVAPEIYEWVSREAPATFTFAPEAGSQRLRDVINKQVTEADVLRTTRQAFAAGAKKLKLYFMIGLPTETDADLDALVSLVTKVVELAPRGGAQVTVSISPFAPKPHTPFQWAGQVTKDEMVRRNRYLEQKLRQLKVKLSLRDPEVSALEALLGLGDDRVGRAVLQVWQLGARFDGWTECFDPGLWLQALAKTGVEPATYLAPADPAAELPWDCVQVPVGKDFLRADWIAAQAGQILDDCRFDGDCYDCAACSQTLEHVLAAPGNRTSDTQARERDREVSPGDVTVTAARQTASFDPRNASREDPAREQRCWTIWRQQAASKCWYRVEHTKEGDLCWLGHLDFQRQLHLALRRSGLPVAYSRGYHPHPLLKFGPPLPVGVSGKRETFDIAFTHASPGWEKILNAFLPTGLQVMRSALMGAFVPVAIDQFTSRLDYRVAMPSSAEGGPAPAELQRLLEEFLASDHWPYLRQRPRGDVEVDARAFVCDGALKMIPPGAVDRQATDGAVLLVSLCKNAGEANLPIHHFLSALCGERLPEPRWCKIQRLGMCGRSLAGQWLTPLEEVGEGLRRQWLRRQLHH